MTITPTCYRVEGHPLTRHEVTIVSRGDSGWTCMLGSYCLSRTGRPEYEPLPSNRTNAFIKRTRFESPEAALKNFEAHVEKFGSQW